MDQGMITADIELPQGSRLEETDKVVSEVEKAFSRYEDDIELVFPALAVAGWGHGFHGRGSSNRGGIYVTLLPQQDRNTSTGSSGRRAAAR